MSVDNSPYDLFVKELKGLINTHCLENLTDTPDYILAAYVVEALKALENLHHAKREGVEPLLERIKELEKQLEFERSLEDWM